jgi:predicted transcriptional regulator
MNMDSSKKLPEAEFDVMVALWNSKTLPVNTAYLMENVGKAKGWKAPTLISFLTRLEDRGFIHSEKRGKERYYYVDAIKTEYVRNVTLEFLNRYHDGSFVNMLDLLYGNNSFTGDELEKLLKWLQEQY